MHGSASLWHGDCNGNHPDALDFRVYVLNKLDMKLRYRENIKPLFQLYLKAKNRGLEDEPWGRALSRKKGMPVKRVLVGDILPMVEAIPEAYRNYVLTVGDFYLFPLDDCCGGVHGFGIRAVNEKSFRVIPGANALFYGLSQFENFKYSDPILLVEGVKEVEAVRAACGYEFTLALLTSQPTKTQFEILSRITRKLLYVGDKDAAGFKAKKFLSYKNVECLLPPVKDLGTYWDDNRPREIELFFKAYRRTL